MKRKIEIGDLIDKINFNSEFSFSNCYESIYCNGDCVNCSERPNNKDDYIKKIKKLIMVKRYNSAVNIFKLIYDTNMQISCNRCSYCRGFGDPDEAGCTCVFIISNNNHIEGEKRFKVAIHSLIKGKYEKES